MFQPKTVAKFAAFAIVVFAALTTAWHSLGFEHAYAGYFRWVGNTAFGQFWFWSEARVHFIDASAPDLHDRVNRVLPGKLPDGFQPPKTQGERDTLLVLLNRNAPGKQTMFRTASRVTGYAPMSVIVALALATPVGWKRRPWVLLWSLVLVHLFVLVRLSVLLLEQGFAVRGKPYSLFEPGPFWTDVLARARVVLADNPTFSYLVTVFIWLAVLFGFKLMDEWRAQRTVRSGADSQGRGASRRDQVTRRDRKRQRGTKRR